MLKGRAVYKPSCCIQLSKKKKKLQKTKIEGSWVFRSEAVLEQSWNRCMGWALSWRWVFTLFSFASWLPPGRMWCLQRDRCLGARQMGWGFKGSQVSVLESWVSVPSSTAIIESACNAGGLGSIPESGRSPGGGNGYPLQYSFLENSVERGGQQSMGSQRVRHDQVTNTFTFFTRVWDTPVNCSAQHLTDVNIRVAVLPLNLWGIPYLLLPAHLCYLFFQIRFIRFSK